MGCGGWGAQVGYGTGFHRWEGNPFIMAVVTEQYTPASLRKAEAWATRWYNELATGTWPESMPYTFKMAIPDGSPLPSDVSGRGSFTISSPREGLDALALKLAAAVNNGEEIKQHKKAIFAAPSPSSGASRAI